ncbi:rhodanese-like domain-containing protein [Alphaproteobacteria bacterium]|nr:rhodanese-like domain-containing protein [Alphaproteobacteria bacterium]
MKNVSVIAFYSFFRIDDLELIEKNIQTFFQPMEIKGTILIGPEGLNGTIAIPFLEEKKTKDYLEELGVQPLNIKVSKFDGKRVFNQFKTKIKKEIVTSGFDLSIEEIEQGQFIDPKKWDEFINQDDVEIIDTRNDYEFKVGHFQKATNPDIKTFREFKKYIEDRKSELQNKKVAIYCTGGIRCEKAGPLMQKYGIDTYQLKGGILKYFEETPASKWDGECFVFDYRVSVDKKLQPGSNELCYGCNMPITPEEKLSPHYEEGFTCPHCYEQLTEKKRRSLADKREHWKRIL